MSSHGFFVTFPIGQTYAVSTTNSIVPFTSTPALLGYNTGMFNTLTHVATVPIEGVYAVSASVNFEWNNKVNSQPIVELSLYVNGTKTILGNAEPVITNDPEVLSFSAQVYLPQDATVSVMLQVPSVSGSQLVRGNNNTFFSMHLI